VKDKTILNYPPESLPGLTSNNSVECPKIHLLTFGGGAERYRLSVSRLESAALMTSWFDEIHALTDKSNHDAINNLLSDHGDFIRANHNIFGYWIWKPYLVDNLLNKIPDQEIVFYMDPGCEISPLGSDRFHEFLELVNHHGTLFFSVPKDEISHTKRLVYDYLEGSRCNNFKQIQASWFALKNSLQVRNMVKEWLRLSCYQNYRFLDNNSYGVEEYPGFAGHRSDQSILSILVKSGGYMTKSHEDLFRRYLYYPNSWVLLEPIHVVRNRSGDSRLTKFLESSSIDKCINDLQVARDHPFYPIRLLTQFLRWFILRALAKLGLRHYPSA
jgi:hypothetical protein